MNMGKNPSSERFVFSINSYPMEETKEGEG
jgi:hypothetical protein